MAYKVEIDSIIADMQKAVLAAYEQGRKDGAFEMRGAIFRAAAAGLTDTTATPPADQSGVKSIEKEETTRAPRGAVINAISKVLADHPAMTLKEIEATVADRDERIAIKSIRNTLGRLEGKLYRRVAGDRWQLVHSPADDDAENESAEDTARTVSSADGPKHNNGDRDGSTTNMNF